MVPPTDAHHIAKHPSPSSHTCSERPSPHLPRGSHQGVLIDLPLPALCAILRKAGPRTRELCKAFLDVYGPLLHLTPRSLNTP